MLKQKTLRMTMGHLCLIVAIIFTLTNPNNAQSEKQQFLWIGFGIGGGSVGNGGLSLGLYTTYQFSKNLLTLRILSSGEFWGKTLNDYSLLYGRVLISSKVFASLGGGLGVVGGSTSHGGFFTKRTTEKIETVIGIPLEAQLFWRPTQFLGLGLYGFANINSEETFYGSLLSLQIGIALSEP